MNEMWNVKWEVRKEEEKKSEHELWENSDASAKTYV